MKLRNSWLVSILAFLGAWLIRGWMRTIRYRYAFPDERVHPTDPRRERFIYTVWHESILFATALKTNAYTLASQHADGEMISQVCRHLGVGVVRGSSTRGGSPALLELLQVSRQAHLLVTPDGPRGPRRRLKLGIIFLTSATGLPIVAAGIGFTHAWRAGSWDRFAVPKPGSIATCVVAPPSTSLPSWIRKDCSLSAARGKSLPQSHGRCRVLGTIRGAAGPALPLAYRQHLQSAGMRRHSPAPLTHPALVRQICS